MAGGIEEKKRGLQTRVTPGADPAPGRSKQGGVERLSRATAASLRPVGRLAALAPRPRRTRGATRRAAARPSRTSRTASVEQ